MRVRLCVTEPPQSAAGSEEGIDEFGQEVEGLGGGELRGQRAGQLLRTELAAAEAELVR